MMLDTSSHQALRSWKREEYGAGPERPRRLAVRARAAMAALSRRDRSSGAAPLQAFGL